MEFTETNLKLFNLIVDILQILVLLITIYITSHFSYNTIKENRKNHLSYTFIELIKQERDLKKYISKEYPSKIDEAQNIKEVENIVKRLDSLYFDYYNLVISLFKQKKIDEDLFYSHFYSKLTEVYNNFLDSPLFNDSQDRINEYEDLCKLFNELGLSIKRIGSRNPTSTSPSNIFQ